MLEKEDLKMMFTAQTAFLDDKNKEIKDLRKKSYKKDRDVENKGKELRTLQMQCSH